MAIFIMIVVVIIIVVVSTTSTPVNLLLKHDTVHTSLQQCKGKTRFTLKIPQSIKNLSTGLRGKLVENRGELEEAGRLAESGFCSSSVAVILGRCLDPVGRIVSHLLHVFSQFFVFV